jgi:uncharacterized phiE125 gp8 family phage protein
MRLTTIERLRAYLGQTIVAKDDALLQSLLEGSSDFFESECGRSILEDTYTDTVDGNGKTSMMLRASPVVSVATVTVDGAAIPVRPSWDGEGYVLQGDRIRLVGYTFTVGISNVEVVYSAGWATVPEDVQMAVCELAAMKFRQRDSVGIFSRTMGGEGQTTYQTITLPVGIQRVIDNYAIPVVA